MNPFHRHAPAIGHDRSVTPSRSGCHWTWFRDAGRVTLAVLILSAATAFCQERAVVPASQAEVNAGVQGQKFVTPKTLAGAGLIPSSGLFTIYAVTNWSTNVIHVTGAGDAGANDDYTFQNRYDDGGGDFTTRWVSSSGTNFLLSDPANGVNGEFGDTWRFTNTSGILYSFTPSVSAGFDSPYEFTLISVGGYGANPMPLCRVHRMYSTNSYAANFTTSTTNLSITTFPRPAVVIILGDSLSQGYPSYNYFSDAVHGGRLSWAHYLFSNYWANLPIGSLVVNGSAGGFKVGNALSSFTNHIERTVTNSTYANYDKLAVSWIGINDITGGSNAISTFLAISNLWRRVRTDGIRTYAVTITHNRANVVDFGQETERYRLNDYIRGASVQYDGLIDMATFIGDVFTNGVMATSADGIHYLDSASAMQARFIDWCIRNGASSPPMLLIGPTAPFTIGTNFVVNQKYTNNFGRCVEVGGTTAKGTGTGRVDLNIDGTVIYSIAAGSNAIPSIKLNPGSWWSYQTNGVGNPTITGGQVIVF